MSRGWEGEIKKSYSAVRVEGVEFYCKDLLCKLFRNDNWNPLSYYRLEFYLKKKTDHLNNLHLLNSDHSVSVL